MARKYIKKEKKCINYKAGSFNNIVHPHLSLFEDLSKEMLSVSATSERWLANILTTLSKEEKVKVSKTTIDGRIFRSYHFTHNFKRIMFEREPKTYPQFGEVEKRKPSIYSLNRATKISDSMCMGMLAGITYEPSQKMALKTLCGNPQKEKKKEGQNSDENGLALSVLKSNLIQEYDDLSYSINPNFIPNYDNTTDKETLLKKCVVYASYEMGAISQLSEDDVNHNKFTAMTGILLTDEEAFCMYHAGQGKMSWLTNGETSQSINVGYGISEIYPKYEPLYKIPNCIIFARKEKLIEELVLGNQKGPVLHMPGKGFDRAHVVPVLKEGVPLLRWIAKHPKFCESVADIFRSGADYEENQICSHVFPVKSVADGTPYCVLVDMDIQKCRQIIRVIEECDYEKVSVICLEWQREWLKRVLPGNTTYVIIKDDAVEKIVDRHIKQKETVLK